MPTSIHRQQLPPAHAACLDAAKQALANAYAPHSGIQVAAALELATGGVITGTNYESDSYGLTLCAERAAIAHCQTDGQIDQIRAILLVARAASSGSGLQLTPCGACRQWIGELAQRLQRDFPIYCFAAHAEQGITLMARSLLPDAFLWPNELKTKP